MSVTGRAARSFILGVCLFAPACWGSNRPASKHARVGDNPKDTDSLYTLLHQALVDSNPHRILQEYSCELTRVRHRLGLPFEDFQRRVDALMDTVYTPAERMREIEVSAGLANGHFSLDKKHCGPDFRELGTYTPDSLPPPKRKSP